MLKILILILLTISLQAETIRIAMAANVSYATQELIKTFNTQHPNTKVLTTLGGTGKLVAQIRHAAPYHLLMAADMRYPKALYRDGLAINEPKIYAHGALVLMSRTEQDFSKGLKLLLDSSIRKIAIANPKIAPYGMASFEALEKSALLEDIKPKLVYGESIAQTVAHTMVAADIGFIAKSSLFAPALRHLKEHIHYKEVDLTLYTPIEQGIVILKNGEHNRAVKEFYDFIFSDEAAKIFSKYGYSLP
ncbi:MAG: molybdate ABC transporter substrate-binding protein [Sulfurovum sp.]|nr:molybdate ABC transporter substrate-binding protein [Sulfurovum sp.]